MDNLMRHPLVVSALTFLLMWLCARLGLFVRVMLTTPQDGLHQDMDLVASATLTLLGLIIGFSFSMAINRYDQRKSLEEAEANAIGTEYIRADLLPAADAANVRSLLQDYLHQRVLFYEIHDDLSLARIDAATAQLQARLWSAVSLPAQAQPSPVLALAVSGMNDVLNSQGDTQSAWWNRIPPGAWFLMAAVAICSNLLVGFESRPGARAHRLLVLPLVLCISFYAIADIDSPRRGVIRVHPQNLISLARSLSGR